MAGELPVHRLEPGVGDEEVAGGIGVDGLTAEFVRVVALQLLLEHLMRLDEAGPILAGHGVNRADIGRQQLQHGSGAAGA